MKNMSTMRVVVLLCGLRTAAGACDATDTCDSVNGTGLLQSRQRMGRLSRSACGTKGSDLSPWIVNGQAATECEWKWQVQLRSGSNSFCGGTLIDEKWVLTAAHCTAGQSAGSFTVMVGDFKKDTQMENGVADKSQSRDVKQIITSGYNDQTMENDVALLELESAVTLDGCTGTVCLPEANEILVGNEVCFITGWGTTNSGGSQPNILQEAEVKIVSKETCSQQYPGKIFDDMLCANGLTADNKVTDACQGDSGGPLVCERANGRWVLHGATSWGAGCAVADKPGIWARVHLFRDWILQETAPTPAPPPTPAPVCIISTVTIQTRDYGDENSWTIASVGSDSDLCRATWGSYGNDQQTVENCCLDTGSYVLTCKDAYGDDWSGGYLTVAGVQYCSKNWKKGDNKQTITFQIGG